MPVATATQARSHLESALLGYSILEVCLANYWVLRFSNGVFLVAQDFAAPEEAEVHAALAATSARVLDAIDPELIPKGVALYRRMRRHVVALDIGDDGSLRLQFEDAPDLRATTNTPIVDWQWATNRSGYEPYSDYEVACFFAGEIQMNTAELDLS